MNDPIGCPFCGGEIEYDEENDYHVCYGCGFTYSTDAGRDVDEVFLRRRPPFTVLYEVPELIFDYEVTNEKVCNGNCVFNNHYRGCCKNWAAIKTVKYDPTNKRKRANLQQPGPLCPRYEGKKK